MDSSNHSRNLRDKSAIAESPPVILDRAHHERLESLALAASKTESEVAELLLQEVGRAELRDSVSIPLDVVNIGSKVTFRYDDTGKRATLCVVYPEHAKLSEGRVSVLTPIGAPLIGLAEGQRMSWRRKDGTHRTITVLTVSPVVAGRGMRLSAH